MVINSISSTGNRKMNFNCNTDIKVRNTRTVILIKIMYTIFKHQYAYFRAKVCCSDFEERNNRCISEFITVTLFKQVSLFNQKRNNYIKDKRNEQTFDV